MDEVLPGQASVEPLVATDDATHLFFGAELAFTIYADKHTSVGEAVGGSWREVASLLTEHQMVDMAAARAAHPHLQLNNKKFRDLLKAGYAFTGTVIEGPRRKAEGCIVCRSMYVLDIEEQNGEVPPSFDEICRRANAKGYRFCIASTFKSTSAKPRYRMCFPLSAPLDVHERSAADRAAAIALAVELGLGKVVDRGKLHGWSLYFFPRAPQGEGETPPQSYIFDGTRFYTPALDALMQEREPPQQTHDAIQGAKQRVDRHTIAGDIEDIAILADAMRAIPNESTTTYDHWVRVGHALMTALGEDGWPLFEEWSARYPTNDPQETESKWRALDPSGEVDTRTIYWLAEQAGWKGKRPDRGRRIVERFLATFKAKNPKLLADWQAAVKQHEAQFGTGDILPSPTIADNDLRAALAGWYEPPDPTTLPRRPWLMRPSYMRKAVSVLGATGGVGKSSLLIVEALALAMGRALLHQLRPVNPCKVCLVNVEDSPDEMNLRIAAAMQLHGITAHEIAGRLKVLSGDIALCLVRRARGGSGAEIDEQTVNTLVKSLKDDGVDALCLDPLAMLHQGEENSNEDMLQLVAALRQVALRANVAVRLVHHTRKMGDEQVDGESLRGASSLFGGARQVEVINTMTSSEAATHGVPDEVRARYFRVSNAKANYGAREGDNWFEIRPVVLPNGEQVATVRGWTPAPIMLDYDLVVDVYRWLDVHGPQRAHPNATGWLGWEIARIVGIEGWAEKSTAAKRTGERWIGKLRETGVIVATQMRGDRQERPGYEAGRLPEREAWPRSGVKDADVHSAQ
jgi:AAA domain/Primase C terminal 2 (PriCT-2)